MNFNISNSTSSLVIIRQRRQKYHVDKGGSRSSEQGVMRLNDDEDGANEDAPMLSPSSRSGVHGTIEIQEGPPVRFEGGRRPKSAGSSSLAQWARSNFRLIYIILAILILLALAVLVVAVFLVVRFKGMDDKYKDASENAKEQFRRLYEQVATFRTGRHGTFKDPDAINFTFTPEQLAQAKMFGLIPDTKNQLSPGIPGLTPIKPVVNENVSQQRDEPSTTQEYHSYAPKESYIPPWANRSCDQKCSKSDYAGTPPLLILSLDGFAREYLDRKLVPSLDLLTKCGARAEYVYPSYPSKTFPNHYTIATGLYPESHGIVDNAAYDPSLSPNLEDMKKTAYPKFFEGEPIWSQAVRHGQKMFCLFWPGCSFNITGHNPTKDVPYNRSMQYSQRVDMVIDWLHLPSTERPSMVMAYFDQPDYIGHFHTTDEQVNLELQYIESVLNYMFTSLYTNGLLDCVNIVVLSDHGMQFLHNKVFVDEHIDISGMLIANGPVGRIHLVNSGKSTKDVMDKFACPADKSYRVFDRSSTPKRFHYARTPRVGDVILDGRPGTTFYPNKSSDYGVTSDHGYDYLDPEMHAIFFAQGPNIQPRGRLPPFQNIEIFNLFVDLLRLPHEVPNNGTYGIFKPILRDLNPIYPPPSIMVQPLGLCQTPNFLRKNEVDNCMKESQACESKKSAINAMLDSCQIHQPPLALFRGDLMNFCLLDACSVSFINSFDYREDGSDGKPKVVFETMTTRDVEAAEQQLKNPENLDCEFILAKYESKCSIPTASKPGLQRVSLMANINNDLSYLKRGKIEAFEGFVKGPFTYLQNLTLQYAKKYSPLMVITGAVFDANNDGIADAPTPEAFPTHIFRILVRCEDNLWHIDNHRCREASATRVLSFVIPNQPKENNCLEPLDYLYLNTARVKDIELLTGLRFFQEPTWYTEIESLRIRTEISQELWSL